tara:strand:+ start:1262 stop:1450 length:189 start_codon:yes stop_codon:yes gene_type:complete
VLDFLKSGGKAPTALILVAAWACALVAFVGSSFGFATFDATGAGLLTGAASALYYGRRLSDD